MASRSYVWLPSNGGTWSLASDWNDTTDGIDPSLTAPGAQDSVMVTGAAGAVVQTIAGPGAAAIAMFAGNTHLSGSFAFGTLVAGVGGAGGLLEVQTGDVLSASTATLASGSLLAGGGSVSIAGTLSAGSATGAGATLYVTSGGSVRSAALFLGNGADVLTIDASSRVEVGQAGSAAAGALTIDAGSALTGQGNANAYGAVVNNGLVVAQGGTLSLGALTGTGTLDIAAGATLKLNGATGAGQSVAFTGALATLAIATEFDAPPATVSGFLAGDAIDMLGSPITGASFTAGTNNTGVLTLTYGGQIAARLTLAGNYAGDVFLPSSDGAGGTDITVAPAAGSSGGPSPGTSTPDSYVWTAAAAGAWNVAANWQDVTAGSGAAAIAPGVHDSVAITGGSSDFLVVAGPGNASTLSIAGAVALSGAINSSTLTVGAAGNLAGGAVSGLLDLTAGAVLRTTAAVAGDGGITVSGQGASLAVAGTLVLGGAPAGVGLPETSLSASEGAQITIAGLAMGGGAGAFVTTDPTSSIVVGTGTGTAGAVTISASATLAGSGTVDPFGAILDNGLIEASGAGSTLTLGPVSGTGSLVIAAGAALDLLSPTALPIAFATASGTLVPTLEVGNELALPTGTLTNFLPGDVIDVQSDPITNLSIARNASGASVLTLYYGTSVVGRLSLLGAFTHQNFLAVDDGSGGTDILLVQQAGSGGGGGSGTTDTLAWTSPVSGAWGRAANWTDVTAGTASTIAPGTANPVIIAGPPGSALQAIGGPGTCSSLLLTGNSVLNGTFATGTLSIGTPVAGVATSALIELLAGASLAASGGATLGAGALEVSGATAAFTVAGTLVMGGQAAAALLAAGGQGLVQLGGLVLDGNAEVTDDSASSIEIGTRAGAAAGAFTVDAGGLVSGAGTLVSGGMIVDNGTIAAAGGTLVIGAFSGVGTLDIGTEATLALTASAPSAATCQIVFQGGGAALDLAGSAQAMPAIIAGFAPGDAIVLPNAAVTSVSWTQGTGHGTLTLGTGGVAATSLFLAGDYSADVFSVQPDGMGSEITVAVPGSTAGPPSGTTTPDAYVWTGAVGSAWAAAADWNDVTAGQTPAAVAPGLHDLVTIVGASGSAFTSIQGPGNAATLALQGNVALAGSFAAGALSVGSGILAIGQGDAVSAASATAVGGIEVQDGVLAVGGTLALQGSASALSAGSQGTIGLGGLTLAAGSDVAIDSTSSLEVGDGTDGSTPGAVTIDPGGTFSGAGSLAAGQLIDDGLVIAAGGTLSVGAASGAGTLLIAQGAELSLVGAAGSGLIIDFAANGTLSASITPAAAIEGFGASDTIMLPFPDATAATYAPTDAGTGLLTITGDGETLGVLTLLGIDAHSQFSVAGAAGGGTVLTTGPGQNGQGGGGSGMSGTLTSGGQVVDTDAFIAEEPTYETQALNQALAGLTSYVWVSPDGTDWGPPDFGYANVALAIDPASGTLATLPYGYHVLIAGGNNAVYLFDNGTGGALLIGNTGNDQLFGTGQNDTLIAGPGANTDLFALGNATMQGGGNDIFVSNFGNVDVTTSKDGHSAVWLGAADNMVTLNGSDTVASNEALSGIASDTVVAQGDASTGDLIVGPDVGQLEFDGGAGRDSVVGHGGTLLVYGGTADDNLMIGNTGALAYFGGTGSALVVGVSSQMQIIGGAGAVTIFGGTGLGHYSAEPGRSYFVVGEGASTITASAGNTVWLIGGANVVTSVNGGGAIAWGANSTGNNSFFAGSGPATLVGGVGNDSFTAGSGNATLDGGSGGADVFNFTYGAAGGTDVLHNFGVSSDKIDLHGYGVSASAVLAAATVSGGNTMLALSDGTHILVAGVTNLTAGSFNVS